MCQRIGLPPISIIGFGMRWVSSPMRTPRPPQKMTTFTGFGPTWSSWGVHRVASVEHELDSARALLSLWVDPGSTNVAVGIGTISFAPHSSV